MKKIIYVLLLACPYLQVFADEQKPSWNLEISSNNSIKPRIGVFHITNDMNQYTTLKNLVLASKDNSIHGILLSVNHYGGAASILSAVRDLIKTISLKKPVIALVIGSAASGGYYMTCAANYIVVTEMAHMGSIGVLREVHKYSNVKINKDIKAHDKIEVLRAGKYKAAGHQYTSELTEEDRKYMQHEIDAIYKIFLANVANDRNLSLENEDQWANARLFTGAEAVEVGLADQVGTLFDFEKKMMEYLRSIKPDLTWSAQFDYAEYETELPKK